MISVDVGSLFVILLGGGFLAFTIYKMFAPDKPKKPTVINPVVMPGYQNHEVTDLEYQCVVVSPEEKGRQKAAAQKIWDDMLEDANLHPGSPRHAGNRPGEVPLLRPMAGIKALEKMERSKGKRKDPDPGPGDEDVEINFL